MMGKWKTCFKLLKFSKNFKRSIWAAIIFFLMGLGLFVGVVTGNILFVMMSAPIIMLSLMMLYQLKENFMFSAMVCVSPKRRFFDTLFSDFLLVSAGVAVYLIYEVMVHLLLKNGDVKEFYTASVLWVGALCITIFMIFLPIYLKYYWVSLIMFYFLMKLMLEYTEQIADGEAPLLRVSTPIGFWMGLGMVLAGGALSVVLRRILYKKPLSKWIVREYMKKMG